MDIKRLQVYKCGICGNIIEVLHKGKPALVCCGEPMKLFEENTTDAAREKHVPVAEQSGNTMTVKVGSTAHPMEDKHYIEWIQVVAGEKAYRQFLRPGHKPEAMFEIHEDDVTIRAYCNLHGLWRA